MHTTNGPPMQMREDMKRDSCDGPWIYVGIGGSGFDFTVAYAHRKDGITAAGH